jgi:NhaP-type Na+/H+ and K+/H+ antiporter
MIFDASLTVRDLETIYHISIPDDSQYETIGGFVLSRLGFMPRGGETFEENGYRFTVMEMDRRRISRIRVKSLAAAGKFAAVNLPEPNDANESNEANEPEQGSESAAAHNSSDFPQPGNKPQTAPDVQARRAK